MKTKNKPHFVIMATIVAVFAALTWSCNKDEDPSLSDLREDKLQYLEDSLRISDSLRLTNNAGIVNYAVTVVDGSASSLYANDGDDYGRTSKTLSAVDGAVVTISQYGKTQTDTTDASGMVVFNGFFRSAVNITVNKTDYTSVSYISGVNITDSTRTGTISSVGNIIPVFAKTGPNTATISGRATIQTDLRNKTRELVPDGTNVSASIDASNNSDFAERFLTLDIDDKIFEPSCGCQFIYVGYILQASYNAGVVGTVTGGNYSLTVPAAVDRLPLTLEYSDVAADQTLYETVAGTDDRTSTYRTLFGPNITPDVVPSGSTVTIGFVTSTANAAGTALISATSGALDRINMNNIGAGYSGTPLVRIIGGGGSGATATATVVNGQLTNINLTSAGTGYTGIPTVDILDGDGTAAADVTTLSQDGTVTSVVISESGFGYTTAPTVTFSAPTGTGLVTPVTATGTAVMSGGRVTGVTITNPGAGYIAPPTVTLSAAPAGGTTATAFASYSGQSISNVQILNAGSEYSFAPAVIFDAPTQPGGRRATGTATVNAATGEVTGITITDAGMGYVGAPGVTLVARTVGAAAEAFLAGGSVLSVDVTAQGAGYTSAPTVAFTGGGGQGATGTAVLVDGKVVAITMTSGGTGYTSAPTVVLQSGTGAAGFATVDNGVITGITITDGGHSYTGAPLVTIGSSIGGGATATASVNAAGAIDGVTMVTGGTGYLEGNTPAGAGVSFSSVKGTSLEVKPGIQYVNDIYYGTGDKQQ